MNNNNIAIAIDISKHFLDLYHSQTKKIKRFANNQDGIKIIIKELSLIKDNIFSIILEPSGGYEKMILAALFKYQFPTSLV